MRISNLRKIVGLSIISLLLCNVSQARPGDIPMDSILTKLKQMVRSGINYLFLSDSVFTDSSFYHDYLSIDEADIITQPVESITELVSMQPGAVGAHFRGGRASGNVFYLDGFSLRNPLTGYKGQSIENYRGPGLNASLGFALPDLAFRNCEVYSTGFLPEFGNVQDAVINLIPRNGTAKHTGLLRVISEGKVLTELNTVRSKPWYIDPGLTLPPDYWVDTDNDGQVDSLVARGGRLIMSGQAMDAEMIAGIKDSSEWGYVKGRWTYINSKPIWVEQRGKYDRTKYAFTITGPVINGMTYSLSGEYTDQDNVNSLARLTVPLGKKTEIAASVLFSRLNNKLYNFYAAKYQGGYLPGYGPLYPPLLTLPERFRDNVLFTFRLRHQINTHSRITLSAARYTSNYEQKRRDYDDRDGDGDRDEYLVYKKVHVKSGVPNTDSYKDTLLWRYTTENEELVYIWTQDPNKIDTSLSTYDPNYVGEWKIGNESLMTTNHLWTTSNPVGWKKIWTPNYDPTYDTWEWTSRWLFVNGDNEFEERGVTHPGLNETIFGVTDAYWSAHGDEYGYSKFTSKVSTLKADYLNQVNSVHLLQIGGEYLKYDLDVFNLRAFSTWNFYLDEWEQTPFELAFYLLDKIEINNLTVNAGFRMDYYNLGDNIIYAADPDKHKPPIDSETGQIINPIKWEGDFFGGVLRVGPRLGWSYRISKHSRFYYKYSQLYQRPDWRYFYENLNYSTSGAYEEIGNPVLEPLKTRSDEVGIRLQIGTNVWLGITAFYKDIFNWIQQNKAGDIPATHFWIYRNDDFGMIKGVELNFHQNIKNYFILSIDYTCSVAKGRLSDPQQGGSYLWQKLAQPRTVHPLDYDQKHTLNATVSIYIPPSPNPMLLFGDWRINVINRYGSGLPFDSQSLSVAVTVPPENDKRRPYTNTLDLKLSKKFAFRGITINMFADVFNLLDRKNLVRAPVNPEWYLDDKEDLDDDGKPDHYLDPEGRRGNWTVWGPLRRVQVGFDIEWELAVFLEK